LWLIKKLLLAKLTSLYFNKLMLTYTIISVKTLFSFQRSTSWLSAYAHQHLIILSIWQFNVKDFLKLFF